MIRQVPKSPSFRQGERSEGWPESSCYGWQLQSIPLIYRHFDLSGYAVANPRITLQITTRIGVENFLPLQPIVTLAGFTVIVHSQKCPDLGW